MARRGGLVGECALWRGEYQELRSSHIDKYFSSFAGKSIGIVVVTTV